MIACARCGSPNPDAARYCMNCGQGLPRPRSTTDGETPRGPGKGDGPPADRETTGKWSVSIFGLSLAASLLLSVVLMFVLKLPVFLLFGFLPLLWWRRKD